MKRTLKVHLASLSHFSPRFAFFVVSTGGVLGQHRTEADEQSQADKGKNQNRVHINHPKIAG